MYRYFHRDAPIAWAPHNARIKAMDQSKGDERPVPDNVVDLPVGKNASATNSGVDLGILEPEIDDDLEVDLGGQKVPENSLRDIKDLNDNAIQNHIVSLFAKVAFMDGHGEGGRKLFAAFNEELKAGPAPANFIELVAGIDRFLDSYSSGPDGSGAKQLVDSIRGQLKPEIEGIVSELKLAQNGASGASSSSTSKNKKIEAAKDENDEANRLNRDQQLAAELAKRQQAGRVTLGAFLASKLMSLFSGEKPEIPQSEAYKRFAREWEAKKWSMLTDLGDKPFDELDASVKSLREMSPSASPQEKKAAVDAFKSSLTAANKALNQEVMEGIGLASHKEVSKSEFLDFTDARSKRIQQCLGQALETDAVKQDASAKKGLEEALKTAMESAERLREMIGAMFKAIAGLGRNKGPSPT
jgi:hypothetical protein